MSKIRVSAFRWVPPFAQGLVREFRVRWALEEAGLPYEERLIGPEEQPSESYRRLQPFGQVPAYEEDGLVMFESGAIVLHIAERFETLMPAEPKARARTKTWMFAALNTLEPPIQNLAEVDLFRAGEEWVKQRRPQVVEAVRIRLGELGKYMEGREYLEERFTAGDLLMTTVLRIPRHTELLAEVPVLDAYRLRCEARPAFKKAMADHMEPFARNAPPSR
ncbi:glutathione S-transferase family protein [Archangium violaceum]|uniref:Glutathione S-transferase n=1 Tax=Archangium violaceum Cb vi76 TaxID=1406225 RepID=A0A084SKP5_9BACT|nr:glutathione S-transferase family protein [Archangium violaceum]KFA89030.1 glutathione S-transferase [Archangium violaceum Cb vi76]